MMFADEIVLLANSAKGLQESINRLKEFCRNWDLSINIEKTKIDFNNLPVAPSFLYTIHL